MNQDLEDNDVLAQYVREEFDGWVESFRERVQAGTRQADGKPPQGVARRRRGGKRDA